MEPGSYHPGAVALGCAGAGQLIATDERIIADANMLGVNVIGAESPRLKWRFFDRFLRVPGNPGRTATQNRTGTPLSEAGIYRVTDWHIL
jgi:hypothetical protein